MSIAKPTKQETRLLLMDIILYLLNYINYQRKIIGQLLNFICRYIPLKQWTFDDSHSPKYQKFKIDELPKILHYEPWDYRLLLPYLEWKYGKKIKPVHRRSDCNIPDDCSCPRCNAPKIYLYKNNGSKGQIWCKVCDTKFNLNENRFTKTTSLRCPHCSRILEPIKSRKHFIIHKCRNLKCPYYLHNLKKVDREHLDEKHGKSKYKLHYIYREFTIDFFKMDLSSLPKNASSLNFKRHDSYTMSLCLTYRVNLGLSLRKTAQALRDIHGIKISHQQVANYCTTAAICVKPFTDNYDYKVGKVLTADETYIKIKGIKGYIWFIMDAAKRSILGYQISDNRGVGPCILSMRMALKHYKEKLPEGDWGCCPNKRICKNREPVQVYTACQFVKGQNTALIYFQLGNNSTMPPVSNPSTSRNALFPYLNLCPTWVQVKLRVLTI